MRHRRLALHLVSTLALLGCGGARAPREQAAKAARAWQGDLSPAPAGGSEVVATIDGDEIYAADVERQARALGLRPREALDQLVTEQLLAREALRRGLQADPEVEQTIEREAVRRLVDTFAEETDQPEEMPEAEARRAFEDRRVRGHYQHGARRSWRYGRVPYKDPRKGGGHDYTEAEAKKITDEIYAELAPLQPFTDPEDFLRRFSAAALARGVPQPIGGPLTAERGGARKTWEGYAWAIEKPGMLSPVFCWPFGCDIILLVEESPAENQSFEQALPDLRTRFWEQWRSDWFTRWIDTELARGLKIERHPEALEHVEVDSTFGLP